MVITFHQTNIKKNIERKKEKGKKKEMKRREKKIEEIKKERGGTASFSIDKFNFGTSSLVVAMRLAKVCLRRSRAL